MATLKLLSNPDPARADGSHHVGSPGGYEIWHFYAEDSAGKIRVAISFHDGFGLHREYVKRYAAYRRRPTRNAPPTASEYPCLQIQVSEDGKLLAGSTMPFPAKSFQAGDGGSVTLGANRAEFGRDEIRLTISDSSHAISAELGFRPILAAATGISFPVVKSAASEHHWIPARPLCEVQGEIRSGSRSISFSGLGQHNHYYGTAPMLSVTSRSIRGTVLFPRAAVMFYATDSRAVGLMADQSDIRTIDDASFDIEWKQPAFFGQPQPISIQFGERLIFRNPRIVAKFHGQLQLLFDAYVDGEQAVAWVEMDFRD